VSKYGHTYTLTYVHMRALMHGESTVRDHGAMNAASTVRNDKWITETRVEIWTHVYTHSCAHARINAW